MVRFYIVFDLTYTVPVLKKRWFRNDKSQQGPRACHCYLCSWFLFPKANKCYWVTL